MANIEGELKNIRIVQTSPPAGALPSQSTVHCDGCKRDFADERGFLEHILDLSCLEKSPSTPNQDMDNLQQGE
jgi:hypothetical protein